MKSLIVLTSVLFLFVLTSNAQTTPATTTPTITPAPGTTPANNKVDASVNKANTAVNSANNSVNNAGATATNAVGTANNAKTQIQGVTGQIGGLLGIKKKTVSAVVIKLPGANRAKMKEMTIAIKTCDGVNPKDVDYDDSAQTITIGTYKGKLNDLLDDIEKKAPQVTDNNATTSKADNSITINLPPQ